MSIFAPIAFNPTPAHLNWRYLPVPGGTELLGWILGPLVPAVVHWSGSSKPCRAALTKGELVCKHCAKKKKARTVGYQPFYTKERERVVVMCSAGVGPKFQSIAFGTPVRLYRSAVPCSPLTIHQHRDDALSFQTTSAIARGKPADIEPWLLHLWKDDTLARYCRKVKRQEEESASVDLGETPLPLALGAVPPVSDNTVTLGTPLIRRGKKPPAK